MQIADFPDLPAVLRNAVVRALSAQHEGRLFEADRLYQQMARRKPLHPLLAHTIAGFLLLKGDLLGAWPLFERRLDLPYYTHRPFEKLSQPVWTGDPIPNERLLIFADLGLGDTILAARFLPWVRQRVGAFSMQVKRGTVPFWRRLFPDAEISALGDPLPDCDWRINLFSLPAVYGAQPQNMPLPPYVDVDEDERARWRDRLGGGFKVGLSWQGNPDHVRDFERSIPLDKFIPILRDKDLHRNDVRFFSLQVDHGRDQLHESLTDIAVEDLAAEIMENNDPLNSSAALVAELDLVIAVDSALANLAGAMDGPFWLPTYKIPDWRWTTFPDLDADNPRPSSWYSSARIYRCGERGKWEPVIEEMRSDLVALTTAR
ncbi:MAG: hypothetical protein COW30_05920 [Rhodospirillales bacterium CG15_BIG_FIL_POST_REV_8_21_14_020_66_15]|nr:MAG: hypothetical protein COW30_05920 [Rhodospirillales bacterium CG15_BIG_FIL_POST_REV_8_21_14_020_66_15]